MTCYQDCHRHLGYLTRETDIARKLLEKHGKASAQAVKELRGETDMPMRECADMLRCLRRDMELERLQTENAKLREQGERLFDKTLELGTENAKLRELVRDMWHDGMCECDERGACTACEYGYLDRMRELGIEVG